MEKEANYIRNDILKLAHIGDIIEHANGIKQTFSDQKKSVEFLEYVDSQIDTFNINNQLIQNIESQKSHVKQKLSDYALQLRLGILDDAIFRTRNRLLLADNINPDPNTPQFFGNKIIMGVYDEMIYSMAELAKMAGTAIWEQGFMNAMIEVKNAVLTPEVWSSIKGEILKGGVSLFTEHGGEDVLYRKTRQILVVLGFAGLVKGAMKKILKTSLSGVKKVHGISK